MEIERLAFAMEDLIDAYSSSGDPDVLRTPEAQRLGDRLFHAIDWLAPALRLAEVAQRFNVALLLATFHYHRADRERCEDTKRAGFLYRVAYQVVPSCLPEELHGISADMRSVACRDPSPSELAGYTAHAVNLLKKAEVTGDVSLLGDATELCLLSARANPRDDLVKAEAFTVLGNVLTRAYEFTDDADALERALVVTVKAGGMVPRDDPYFRAVSSGLGHIAIRTFQRTGDRYMIDMAVLALRQAAYEAPDDDPHRAAYLTNLSTALTLRAQCTGRTDEADEAFEAQCEAVRITPRGHPDAPSRLINLAGALLGGHSEDVPSAKAPETGPADGPAKDRLDLAVSTLHGVLTLLPEGHPDRTGCRYLLVHALQVRYENKADPADLARAVEVGRSAVRESLAGGYLEPDLLRALARSLTAYAGAASAPEALTEATQVLRRVTDLLAQDHPDRTETLIMLGLALRDRFEIEHDPTYREQAAEALREACHVPSAPARARTLAAATAGRMAADAQDFEAAMTFYELALEQLELVAWRGLERSDQESLISAFPDVVTDAAACAVRAGEHEHAVELLEQGRGILLAQALETRADQQALRAEAPHLADRLSQVLKELEELPDSPYQTASWTPQDRRRANARRAELAHEREEILSAIRRLPELAGFLRSPSYASLREAAARGPVIVLIASRHGCCALVLTETGVQAVPLEVEHGQVAARVVTFLHALAPDQSPLRAHEVVVDTLTWLWHVVAVPVLEASGHSEPKSGDEQPPRLWWCPTGLFTVFPLHAAGHHLPSGGRDSVPDRVISSYTPTLRALVHARKRPHGPSRPDTHRLAVSLPCTPHWPDLPAAEEETRALRRRHPDTRLLTGSAATIRTVLEALDRCSWAHFACHGTQDPAQPSRGALILHDGPLTLSDIARLRVPHAEFAFLSACETSRGGLVLADEALSLAATLQVAGFRDVIGTLWSIDDAFAPAVSDLVYEHLAHQETRDPAAALHAAIAAVRAQRPEAVLLWAPYVHVGP
ncbi:CHAT domain-containing protein [Streptomyces sp. NPDC013455]|uniref:CHAT domain-containing protein n=1 Tax=Streptomyces sp. NPDC013455 TaxID=3155605 RepID=UPI0034117DCA